MYFYLLPEDNHSTHVPLDAVALAKQKQLRVPKYLYAKRPSLPKCNNGVNGISHATNFNVKQALIEDPVRRRALFTSIIGGPPFGQFSLRRMRGLRLTPSRINVGVLPYGVTRSFSVKLVNWGPETAYFKIKQLPIQSGIRVFYTPGPIPAGKFPCPIINLLCIHLTDKQIILQIMLRNLGISSYFLLHFTFIDSSFNNSVKLIKPYFYRSVFK